MLQNSQQPPRFRLDPCAGLTLLELMIAVAIVGVLAAIATPAYVRYLEKTYYTVVISDLYTLEKEIIGFNILHNRFPDGLDELGLEGVDDPWGNPYQYYNVSTAKGNGTSRKNRNLVPVNSDFDLYSMGPDGDSKSPFTAKASQDDIVRASNGAFFGRVSDY